MKTLDKEMVRLVESAKATVKRYKENLDWAERQLALAEKQAACEHKNVDCRGVFGSTCLDCDYFFNDGF